MQTLPLCRPIVFSSHWCFFCGTSATFQIPVKDGIIKIREGTRSISGASLHLDIFFFHDDNELVNYYKLTTTTSHMFISGADKSKAIHLHVTLL